MLFRSGIILSGSPFSVHQENALIPDLKGIKGVLPILGVCYGAQYLVHSEGGKVEPSNTREYGRAHLTVVDKDSSLFAEVSKLSQVWMSHGDTITCLPDNFELIASTETVKNAAFKIKDEVTYGIQFHPEVYHSVEGTLMLKNFVVDICGCKQNWTPDSFIETTVKELKDKVGNDKVILGLSGGVDSTVAAVLLHKAIGPNLICIFVNNGLLRKNEFEGVLDQYKGMNLNVIGVDATDKFMADLAGVTDPERKRKIIGGGFIEVFDEEAKKITDARDRKSVV